MLWLASVALCPNRATATVSFEHDCALHYTLTRLPCKRASMDKSILAQKPFHFRLREEAIGWDFVLFFRGEHIGPPRLVNLAHTISRRIDGVKHRKGGARTHRLVDIHAAGDELAGLASHVHHAGKLRHVPLALSTPTKDTLDEVVDYDFIRRSIGERVSQGHVHLQETLADDVLKVMLAHPRVRAARVATEKPDVYPDCDAVGVEVFGIKEGL